MSRHSSNCADCTSPDAGAALIITLLVVSLLASLGASLALSAEAETAVTGNLRGGLDAAYAADAAMERVVADLRLAPDLSMVLNGGFTSAFVDGTRAPITPGGRQIDLNAATAALQARRDLVTPPGVGRTVWRLFSWGPLPALLEDGLSGSHAYVAVWVGDDVSDEDGDPEADANGRITVMARAYGLRDTQRDVEATLAFGVAHTVQFLSWREVR